MSFFGFWFWLLLIVAGVALVCCFKATAKEYDEEKFGYAVAKFFSAFVVGFAIATMIALGSINSAVNHIPEESAKYKKEIQKITEDEAIDVVEVKELEKIQAFNEKITKYTEDGFFKSLAMLVAAPNNLNDYLIPLYDCRIPLN